MQTLNKTQYHCAELRRSVPLIQRVEWGERDWPRRCRAGCARRGLRAGQPLPEGSALSAYGRRVGRLDGRPGSPSDELGRLAYCFSNRTM